MGLQLSLSTSHFPEYPFSPTTSQTQEADEDLNFPSACIIMETSILITQHNIVASGNSHKEVGPRHCAKESSHFLIILIHFHMVGITGCNSHRQSMQLTHEQIL